MNQLTILWLWRLGGALLLVGSLTAGYFGWRSHQRNIGDAQATERYETALTKQKTQAATLLAAETAKAAASTQALRDFKDQQEITDGINEKATVLLADKLHAAGRLRDPNQETRCGGSGGGAQGANPAGALDSGGDPAQAGGLLSAELSDLLRERIREADGINNAYTSCRADAYKVRAELSK